MAVELMTRDEARTFADKLERFALTLPPKEQALLREILLRAAGASDDDVEGHALFGASIATLTTAAAAAIGVTADSNAMHVIATLHTQPAAYSAERATTDGAWGEEDEGGMK